MNLNEKDYNLLSKIDQYLRTSDDDTFNLIGSREIKVKTTLTDYISLVQILDIKEIIEYWLEWEVENIYIFPINETEFILKWK